MSMPYQEPLVPRAARERVIPEPPRRGEPDGEPCGICGGAATEALWHDELWTLHAPVSCSLPGTVWLASREHFDSFAEMPDNQAADFGRVAGRMERAALALGGVARAHLYRWARGTGRRGQADRRRHGRPGAAVMDAQERSNGRAAGG